REGIEHVRARSEQHIEPTLAYELRDGRHVAGHPGAWRASIGRGEIREVIARREGSVARAETAAGETELAGERGERGHRASRLPAVAMLVHAGAAHHDHRGLHARVFAGEAPDVRGGQPRLRRRPLRREALQVLRILLEANRMSRDEV